MLDKPQATGLTLEQQFKLRTFSTTVKKMSREQAQEHLVKLYEQMLVQETTYKTLLAKQWGIEPSGYREAS